MTTALMGILSDTSISPYRLSGKGTKFRKDCTGKKSAIGRNPAGSLGKSYKKNAKKGSKATVYINNPMISNAPFRVATINNIAKHKKIKTSKKKAIKKWVFTNMGY